MPATIRHRLTPLFCALALSILFWWPLYLGAGFIGGDLYPYFFPQKAFYAESLKSGKFPLWNDLVGFGYPILGESQTGAAYPFHFLFYGCLDLNTAYNAEHLLHYLICFVATWQFSRRVGLQEAGAALSALVFTYGWFPPRSCLEWAILTGAWLPVALWCIESYLQTRLWRHAIGLSFALGLQLLAGHYHLAFITDLIIVTYASFRLWNSGGESPANDACLSRPCRKQTAFCLLLAITAGAGLASIQLLPTWELKQRSTRVITGGDYDPAYGQMPPIYISQSVAPWLWYSPGEIGEENLVRDFAELAAPWHWFGPMRDPRRPDELFKLDDALHRCYFAATSTGTNKVEAHFYCGLIAIGFAFCSLIGWARNLRQTTMNNARPTILTQSIPYWLIAGLFGLAYATGLLLPIGRHLPGFSFFRGPGRYGIITTLAVGLLAGQFMDKICARLKSRSLCGLALIIVFASTCGDLWLVSRMVRYATMVAPPRINFREASQIRQILQQEPGLPRLLFRGPNVGTLFGVSCVPWYLGMAPAEYVDPQLSMPPIPKPLTNNAATPGSPELITWLSRSGVTHVLNFEPLDETSWNVELIWKGVDQFLLSVWARQEPVYLYRFRQPESDNESLRFPGRAYLSDDSSTPVPVERDEQSLGSRQLTVDAKNNTRLILTELAFPGWTARAGNQPLETKQVGMFRAVDIPEGHTDVTWTYQPSSVLIGGTISLATLILLALIGHLRFWHPRLVDRMLSRFVSRAGCSIDGPPTIKS